MALWGRVAWCLWCVIVVSWLLVQRSWPESAVIFRYSTHSIPVRAHRCTDVGVMYSLRCPIFRHSSGTLGHPLTFVQDPRTPSDIRPGPITMNHEGEMVVEHQSEIGAHGGMVVKLLGTALYVATPTLSPGGSALRLLLLFLAL